MGNLSPEARFLHLIGTNYSKKRLGDYGEFVPCGAWGICPQHKYINILSEYLVEKNM